MRWAAYVTRMRLKLDKIFLSEHLNGKPGVDGKVILNRSYETQRRCLDSCGLFLNTLRTNFRTLKLKVSLLVSCHIFNGLSNPNT
jgi:hypothetical protein